MTRIGEVQWKTLKDNARDWDPTARRTPWGRHAKSRPAIPSTIDRNGWGVRGVGMGSRTADGERVAGVAFLATMHWRW